jgi:hypothetical protein
MKVELNLTKMESDHTEPVNYYFTKPEPGFRVNDLIGKNISIQYKDRINCIRCGTEIKTSFAQGYCYPCFISSPETEDCVLHPELCQAHLGIARDIEFAKHHCLIDHYVYMAISGGLKVGVTRNTQKPFRWIDQGASKAIIIAQTPNRFLAGSIEVFLKKYYQDKTNWRKMLSSESFSNIDLIHEKKAALNQMHPDFKKFSYSDDSLTELVYPVIQYPLKIVSVNFDKKPQVAGILKGIRGQYMIFDTGEVINIRKHGGYLVEITY